ncbi:DegT/DnrJ/EryC1/StrS family aminotransferase [Methylocapsa polymorpha]|uniref:DegT/DnrJ/EryC1/StrS family aminotransferase n=1 Tax=Methylocapsa polymorpha TaxID=3080828 RepID=A0ABZ0HYN1_9HYPH|nr:DegT/DnrJ/EryC1/StrS family aminotransferase [Methylocapsa sp. RX1]
MTANMLPLSDPDMSQAELDAVIEVLQSSQVTTGEAVEAFEEAFARYLGRKHAIAVSSATMGLMLTLDAYGIGPGAEVIASPHSFREIAHAISIRGAFPIFADIDYWSGALVPEKAERKISEKTKAIVASNVNGHPAAWTEFREIADRHKLILIEDSSEAIGSTYKNALVGTFGDCSIFDFSQPGPLVCGQGGVVVTDDIDVAMAIRRHRMHRLEERASVVVGGAPSYNGGMSNISAALALAQLQRLELILERRKRAEYWYYDYVKSFEGIKDPYIGPDVTEAHWFLYVVHLGTRFSRSGRDGIIEDLKKEEIEAAAYSMPLHLQPHYFNLGYRKSDFLVTEKVADRAVILPFHAHLTEDQIAFIVGSMKDASINIGAGAEITL